MLCLRRLSKVVIPIYLGEQVYGVLPSLYIHQSTKLDRLLVVLPRLEGLL